MIGGGIRRASTHGDVEERRVRSSRGRPRPPGVKLHHDERSDIAARRLGADAFTVGDDIYFRRGKLDPTTAAGQRLLAHEFAHSAGAARDGTAYRQETTDPVDLLDVFPFHASDRIFPTARLGLMSGVVPPAIAPILEPTAVYEVMTATKSDFEGRWTGSTTVEGRTLTDVRLRAHQDAAGGAITFSVVSLTGNAESVLVSRSLTPGRDEEGHVTFTISGIPVVGTLTIDVSTDAQAGGTTFSAPGASVELRRIDTANRERQIRESVAEVAQSAEGRRNSLTLAGGVAFTGNEAGWTLSFAYMHTFRTTSIAEHLTDNPAIASAVGDVVRIPVVAQLQYETIGEDRERYSGLAGTGLEFAVPRVLVPVDLRLLGLAQIGAEQLPSVQDPFAGIGLGVGIGWRPIEEFRVGVDLRYLWMLTDTVNSGAVTGGAAYEF